MGGVGAQIFQVIEGPLAPVIPGDGCPFLVCFFTRHQFMQGSGYLHELGDKLGIAPHEPQKLRTSMMVVGWAIFDNTYFPLVSCYALGGDDVSHISNLPAE